MYAFLSWLASFHIHNYGGYSIELYTFDNKGFDEFPSDCFIFFVKWQMVKVKNVDDLTNLELDLKSHFK